jgi:AraC-like DNA-binding protein
MAVSAHSVKDLLSAANEAIDLRLSEDVRAGTYLFEDDDLVTDWHTHDQHQIQYAFEGVAEVETSTSHYLLPPQQAAWIPAGLSHRTTLKRVRAVAVFFDKGMAGAPHARVRVLAAAPVIREMIIYGTRWPISRPASDATADAFFDALVRLTCDGLAHDAPLCLPTSADPTVQAIMAYTQAHLAHATSQAVALAVGVSERSLRRHFGASTGMTWRQYLLTSRLLRAMALLAEPGRTVLHVATEVGFESLSAFTRSFRRLTGETPTSYRTRAISELGVLHSDL